MLLKLQKMFICLTSQNAALLTVNQPWWVELFFSKFFISIYIRIEMSFKICRTKGNALEVHVYFNCQINLNNWLFISVLFREDHIKFFCFQVVEHYLKTRYVRSGPAEQQAVQSFLMTWFQRQVRWLVGFLHGIFFTFLMVSSEPVFYPRVQLSSVSFDVATTYMGYQVIRTILLVYFYTTSWNKRNYISVEYQWRQNRQYGTTYWPSIALYLTCST